MRRPARASLPALAGMFAVLLVLAPGGYLGAAAAQTQTYVRLFPGTPSAPQPFNAPDIDVTILSHDNYTMFPMQAAHGPDCSAPPATHTISNVQDAVFQCNNHIMTAIFSGYGSIYLTPNQLMDFSQGEAVLRWNMSTLRTSSRDWIDFTIQPFDQEIQINFEDAHVPQEAVHFQMIGGGSLFEPSVWRNYVKERIPADMFTGYDTVLTPSATRRDTFELRMTQTHIKFGMPDYNLWWVDTDIAPLGWNVGVVQLNQRSYNVMKGCARQEIPESMVENRFGVISNPYGEAHCPPNTWHWDNIQIQPAIPFAMLRADRRVVDAANSGPLNFPAPAPAGSILHFVAAGVPIEYSLDNGGSWQPARIQGRPLNRPEHGEAYKQPIPEGTTSVMLRGHDNGTINWAIQDISIWGPPGTTSAGGSQLVPEGAISSVAVAPPSAPQLESAPAAAAAVVAPAPAPAGAIAFDDLPNPNRTLNGHYPDGVIDWGTNSWYLSGPFGAFTTQSIGFNGPGLTSGTFAFVTPRTLASIDAYNGGQDTTVTVHCDGQPDVSVTVPSRQLTTVATGWSGPCGSVTLTSTNGWDTNFKNLVLAD
jgi:hypothetical protein